MFFRKKEKATTNEVAKEDEQKTAAPIDESGQEATMKMDADIENTRRVRKRRQRVEENKTVTVEEVKEAVRKPVFKNQGTAMFGAEQGRNYADVNEQQTVISDTARTAIPVKTKQNGYFTVTEEEKPVQVASISSDIASAFGIISSGQMPDASAGDSVCESEPLDSTEDFTNKSEENEPAEVKNEESSVDELTESFRRGVEKIEERQCSVAKKSKRKECHNQINIVERLKKVQEKYASIQNDAGSVEVLYYDNNAADIVMEDGKFFLANNKVYINGRLEVWDSLFEVRVPVGAEVEIETGIGFKIPSDCQLNIECSKESSDKFYFKPMHCIFGSNLASDPVTITLEAQQGAYLSKVGRLIECQIVAS